MSERGPRELHWRLWAGGDEVSVHDGALVDVVIAARVAGRREVLGRGACVGPFVEQTGSREASRLSRLLGASGRLNTPELLIVVTEPCERPSLPARSLLLEVDLAEPAARRARPSHDRSPRARLATRLAFALPAQRNGSECSRGFAMGSGGAVVLRVDDRIRLLEQRPSDVFHSGKFTESVPQVISRLISSYWWIRKLQFAIAVARWTPSGASTSSWASRLAASPSFIISESPAS
jgi:hypothetical protein